MRFTSSTIVPSEFKYLDSYDLGTGSESPFNLGTATRLMAAGAGPVENHEGLGRCDICGAFFRYGEVWRHVPTDHRITIGHICASKYGLMAYNPEYARLHAAHILKLQRIAERRAIRYKIRGFLSDNPGLGRRLKKDHHILADLRANLIRWGSLTEKQIELVGKIEQQEAERASEKDALGPKVPVPSFAQRRRLTGLILGIKWQDDYRGNLSCKMLFAVPTEGGHYTLWGTMPKVLQDMLMAKEIDEDKGLSSIVQRLRPMASITISVQQSKNDPTFGFFSRPTKPELGDPALPFEQEVKS